MGILNVTPDSFSDGGHFVSVDKAIDHARRMIGEGAAIIDIGGESTRPGAVPVAVADELQRVIPVVEALQNEVSAIISVDTSRPEVMTAAIAAGATIINDVRALQLPGALAAVAQTGVAVCLMHMQGDPRTMQAHPHYADVTTEVTAFLRQRVAACRDAGIRQDRLMIDPGFGFGKSVEHNLELLNRLDELRGIGVPVVAGLSRKSLIGKVLDRNVEQRLWGGIACAVIACWQGAAVIRTHDVAATRDAVRMCHAIKTQRML
jgi:dihydropteroate synthase